MGIYTLAKRSEIEKEAKLLGLLLLIMEVLQWCVVLLLCAAFVQMSDAAALQNGE